MEGNQPGGNRVKQRIHETICRSDALWNTGINPDSNSSSLPIRCANDIATSREACCTAVKPRWPSRKKFEYCATTSAPGREKSSEGGHVAVLGPSTTYTCAVFETTGTTLTRAQENNLVEIRYQDYRTVSSTPSVRSGCPNTSVSETTRPTSPFCAASSAPEGGC